MPESKPNKCLGCHTPLEARYHFCSITCACLAGYFSVRKGALKDMKNIPQDVKDHFLNNPPLRDRGEKYL